MSETASCIASDQSPTRSMSKRVRRLLVHLATVALSVVGSAVLAMVIAPNFAGTAALISLLVSGAVSLLVGRWINAYRRIIYRQKADLLERNEQLVQRNGELKAFAHTVAHDLRNPLTGVRGFGELIAEGPLQGQWRADEAEALGREVLEGCDRMRDIISDLLVLGSVSQQEVEIAPVAMGPVLEKVMDRLARQITVSGAEVTMPSTWPEALGHASWIEQVWVNYVSNALKYGGTPPRVEISWQQVDRGFRFSVADDGAGLTENQRSKLFQEFSRLEPQRVGGHGLGLWIVRKIATKLGGKCGVESDPGNGSRFYFDLPRAPYDHLGPDLRPVDLPNQGFLESARAILKDRMPNDLRL